MKKVVVYTENYEYGGLERFLFDLLFYLKQRHDIFLLFNKENKRIEDFAFKNNIKYQAVKISSIKKQNSFYKTSKIFNPFVRYFYLFINYFRLKKLFFNLGHYENLYIVNGGYPAADSCRIASILGREAGILNIIHVVLSCPVKTRNIPVIKQLEDFIDKKVHKSISFFQTNCEKIKTELCRIKKFSPQKIKVVYTGIKLPKEHKRLNKIKINNLIFEKKENETWLGMISFIDKLKGHKYLLKAVKILLEKNFNIKCLLVGNGPEFNNLQKLSKQLNLDKNVLLTGKYPGDISDIYNFIDIFVFSSLHEGLPYVITEAMAYKLPVVSTSVGGIPEQIQDGLNGWLTFAKDAENLSDKIITAVNEKHRFPEIREANYRKAAEKFSVETMFKNIENIIV